MISSRMSFPLVLAIGLTILVFQSNYSSGRTIRREDDGSIAIARTVISSGQPPVGIMIGATLDQIAFRPTFNVLPTPSRPAPNQPDGNNIGQIPVQSVEDTTAIENGNDSQAQSSNASGIMSDNFLLFALILVLVIFITVVKHRVFDCESCDLKKEVKGN